MKNVLIILIVASFLASCTSTEKLTYLNNLPETSETQYFPMDIPDYKIQYRDILFISAKAMTSDGLIEDVLQGSRAYNQSSYLSSESSQYTMGYVVDENGAIFIPVLEKVKISGRTIEEVRELLQLEVNKYFNNTFVEVKLLSFKFTVLGEAKLPGTYVNYNSYLTVLEAIGRAGGIGDYGRRDRVLIVRPTEERLKNLPDQSSGQRSFKL